MKLFILENYEAKINKDEVLLVPEFAALFELKYNKGKGDSDGRLRKRAHAELTYMYFMHSFTSELKEYSEEERHIESLHAAGLPDNYTLSDELKAACEKYVKLQETRSLKLLNSANIAIDRMRTYFETIDYTKTTANGSLVNDPNRVATTIGNLHKAIEAMDKLEKKVRLDLGEEAKNRGDQEEGRIR